MDYMFKAGAWAWRGLGLAQAPHSLAESYYQKAYPFVLKPLAPRLAGANKKSVDRTVHSFPATHHSGFAHVLQYHSR